MTDSEFISKRLDNYVAEREGITRSASQKLIENGMVTVNGKPAKSGLKLRPDDIVSVTVPPPEPTDTPAEDISLDILYEDTDLLVVNKPKGMVVHPAPGNRNRTLVNALLYHCGDSLSSINGVIRPGIVHRIDKNTAGLLVVAKNDRAHRSLSSQISSHSFERIYHAVVVGHPREDSGTVDAPLSRNPSDRKKIAVCEDGRQAVTHYRVIGSGEGVSLLRLRLETGRTHQIRVHMASIGHPVLNDDVYSSRKSIPEKIIGAAYDGQCLLAKTISFTHPSTGELMRFECGYPDFFNYTVTRLGIVPDTDDTEILC